MFFSIDGCGDVELHDDEIDAYDAAEASIQEERDQAGDGWSEDVTRIMFGKVLGTAQETSNVAVDPEIHFNMPADVERVVDYGIVSVDETEPAVSTLADALRDLADNERVVIRKVRYGIQLGRFRKVQGIENDAYAGGVINDHCLSYGDVAALLAFTLRNHKDAIDSLVAGQQRSDGES